MKSIEQLILVSILEHNFIPTDIRILQVELNQNFFTNENHKVFVKAINRLKQLNEPIDSDTMRMKFIDANAWDKSIKIHISMEQSLLEIMSHNPAGSYDLFMKYYAILERNYNEEKRLEELKYI